MQRTTRADGRFGFAGLPAGRHPSSAKGGEGPDRPVSTVVVAGDREQDLGDLRLPK